MTLCSNNGLFGVIWVHGLQMLPQSCHARWYSENARMFSCNAGHLRSKQIKPAKSCTLGSNDARLHKLREDTEQPK